MISIHNHWEDQFSWKGDFQVPQCIIKVSYLKLGRTVLIELRKSISIKLEVLTFIKTENKLQTTWRI